MKKKEREKIRLELLHLKEGGLEDLLLEYAEAVIEDHQEQLEGNCSLTSVPIAERIDSEVIDIIEQELDKARREYFSMGMEYFSLIDDSNIYQKKGWKLSEEKAERLQILDRMFNLLKDNK